MSGRSTQSISIAYKRPVEVATKTDVGQGRFLKRLQNPSEEPEADAGHCFNPNKLVLDPYAYADGELQWDPALFGYQMESGDDRIFVKCSCMYSHII